jgi:hypothetical protein
MPEFALGNSSIRKLILDLAMILPLLMVVPVQAAPATQPDSAQYRTWITQLADPDPDIRDAATQNLMGLGRVDLPTLREAALSQRPLLPEQVGALHDIVRQVFLSSDPYRPLPDVGFLGVTYEPTWLNDHAGLIVADRLPGFDGFRALRNGDVIVKLLDLPDSAPQNALDLKSLAQTIGPGHPIHLQVIRNGRSVNVSVLLEPRPLDLHDGQVTGSSWLFSRLRRAGMYWDSNFSVLDQDSATTEASAP